MQKRSSWLADTALVLASVVFAFLLFEFGVRAYLYYKYVMGNYEITASSIQTDPGKSDKVDPQSPLAELKGWAKANTEHYRWKFDAASNIVWTSQYRGNNAGLISRHDYVLERQGREYRVALLGDSFVAALEMNTPWPDLVEAILNKDAELRAAYPGVAFKVFNFGMYSAGFQEFLYEAGLASKLQPDLIVVNFIAADFPRCNNCSVVADNAFKERERKLVGGSVEIRAGDGPDDAAQLDMTCEKEPVGFENDTCRHSFSLRMSPALASDKDKVARVKQEIVSRYLRGVLWKSTYPYSLALLTGKPLSLHSLRNAHLYGGGPEPRKLTEPEQVDQAVTSLESIAKVQPNMLLTLHPTYDDMAATPDEKLTDAMTAKDQRLHVVKMRTLLPQGLSKEEYKSWYCLPYDGHMSQKGGNLYAEAMAGVIKKRLLEQAKAKPSN